MIRRPTPRPPRRPGFTLVELLVVITIIGILIALLLPAIIGAVRRANEARVSADIQTIALGLQTFKNTYGEFPPSRVVLSESGVYSTTVGQSPQGAIISPLLADYQTALGSVTWYGTVPAFGSADISFGTLAERSLRALRKYFPKVVPPTSSSPGFFHDFNGDNVMCGGLIYLQGDECLAFFLGGIPNPAGGGNGGFGMSGFVRDPSYPFVSSLSPKSRTQSLFEFKPERLIDDDGDGIPSYYDPAGTGSDGRPYAYFASYGASFYDPNDCNFEDFATFYQFQVGTTLSDGTNVTGSPAPNPYTSSTSVQVNLVGNNYVFNPGQPVSYLAPNSFQIVSSGLDRVFGPGGQYSASAGTEKVPPPPQNSPFVIPPDNRFSEHDNLTNFAAGRLE